MSAMLESTSITRNGVMSRNSSNGPKGLSTSEGDVSIGHGPKQDVIRSFSSSAPYARDSAAHLLR